MCNFNKKASFMNKQKRRNMNNFKKIGVTALAGSLAAVSANAIELAVTGETTVSYITNTSDKTSAIGGQGIGTSTAIYFNGSGELENGFTVSTFSALEDGAATSLSSSQLNLGMGSLGTITFAQAGGTNANGIDDVTPKVAEEAWDQASGSVLQGFGSSTNSGSVAYKSSAFEVEGFALSFGVDYDPQAGAGNPDHDAVTAGTSGVGSGTALVVKATSDLGLTLGAGVEEIQGDGPNNSDRGNVTGYALYSMGPVSVGLQMYYLDNGSMTGADQVNDNLGGGAADYSGEAYSIAFAVNDDLSVGYQVVDETKESQSAVASTNREITSISAAYTTGGMTVSVQTTDTDNYAMAAAGSEVNSENIQVTLSFAF